MYREGPATQVSLSVPQHLALDHDGSLYIASSATNVVMRLKDGVLHRVVGGGTRAFAEGVSALEVRNPHVDWLVVDGEGLLVFEELSAGVWRVRNGLLERVLPIEQGAIAAAAEPAGNLILADVHDGVRRLFPNGTTQRIAGNGMAGDCGLGGPAIHACYLGGHIAFCR